MPGIDCMRKSLLPLSQLMWSICQGNSRKVASYVRFRCKFTSRLMSLAWTVPCEVARLLRAMSIGPRRQCCCPLRRQSHSSPVSASWPRKVCARLMVADCNRPPGKPATFTPETVIPRGPLSTSVCCAPDNHLPRKSETSFAACLEALRNTSERLFRTLRPRSRSLLGKRMSPIASSTTVPFALRQCTLRRRAWLALPVTRSRVSDTKETSATRDSSVSLPDTIRRLKSFAPASVSGGSSISFDNVRSSVAPSVVTWGVPESSNRLGKP
mmetsp:Transcript_33098/g.65209  ORF Transcript_33098/g.65209 Transcript_33098/m.65209 type:complete len:269 (-) Transcript_33098:1469-2275(-)